MCFFVFGIVICFFYDYVLIFLVVFCVFFNNYEKKKKSIVGRSEDSFLVMY